MKKIFSIFIAMIMAIIVMTFPSCDKEGDVIVNDYDTTIVTVTVIDSSRVIINGDTISIENDMKVEGDTISIDNSSRAYADPEINVEGSTVTNTTNGGSGDNGGITISEGCSLWEIPAEEFPSRVLYSIYRAENGSDKALFERRELSSNQKAIAFYDGTSEGTTTLSFPFKKGDVWTIGAFGATADKQRTIYALRINGGSASVGIWGYGNTFTVAQQFLFLLEEEFVLCGLAGSDGNSPNERTGRTLLGTDGANVYLFVTENATTQEAFDAFVQLGVCQASQIITVSGGSSSLGRKPVPLWLNLPDQRIF